MKPLLSKKLFFLSRTFIACSLILSAVSCKKNDDAGNYPTPPPGTTFIKLDSSSLTLGKRLTDKNGNALYFFAKDLSGNSTACTGGCANVWHPFLATNGDLANLPAGLDKNDFSLTADGKQSTYKKWPLYTYAPGGTQEAPNFATGEGLGGVWMVAKPNYSVAIVDTTLSGADQRFLISKGLTLYFDNKDDISTGVSGIDCKGGCLGVWPIVNAVDAIIIPSFLNKNDFGSFSRTDIDGSPKQMTYKGHLVYIFSPDAGRGSVKGQGVGAKWFVINP